MTSPLLRIRRQNAAGFTLVELMIVVAIIGVLAALAIYGVSRYLKHSKTAEATRTLGALETGSKAKYQKETVKDADAATGNSDHVFCGAGAVASDTGGSPQPTSIPKAQKMTGVYTGGVWKCLSFSLNQPQFYRYSYTSSGAGSTNNAVFAAVAEGDLDGNGTASTFTINGKVVDGEATRNGPLTIANEDE